jgi:condensin complex subunit 2
MRYFARSMAIDCGIGGLEGAVPFNTQFFHDDDDDGPGFDDGFDGDIGDVPPNGVDPGEQDLLAETQGQQRRVRPIAVNYTKRAKRVDVRKLKENIWKGLQITLPQKGADAMVRGSSYSIACLRFMMGS